MCTVEVEVDELDEDYAELEAEEDADDVGGGRRSTSMLLSLYTGPITRFAHVFAQAVPSRARVTSMAASGDFGSEMELKVGLSA